MRLLVTAKARGEVIFPTIQYPVKAGQYIYVDKTQYYANDIQTALRQGYLEADEDESKDFADSIEIVNISERPIGIGNISLLKDERKYISDEDAAHPQVELAASQGMVELFYPEEEEEEKPKPKPKKKNTRKKSKKKSKKKTTKKAKKVVEEVEEPEEEEAEVKDSTYKMQSWDANKQKLIDKQESSDRVVQKVGGHVPDSDNEDVQSGDIDFTETNEVEEVEEKPKTQRKKTKRKVKKKKRIKLSASSKEGSTRKKSKSSIKPVGRVREEKTALPGDEAISFVDREQNVQRMQERGLAPQNDEID